MSKEERLKLIVPLQLQGYGPQKIAEMTGIPVGTVKSDLHRLKNSVELQASSDSPQSVATRVQPDKPAAGTFDWEAQLDKAGSTILALFARALKEKREEDAMRWMDRFIKAVQAKMGAMRINIQNSTIAMTQQNIVLQENQDFRRFVRALHTVCRRIQRKYGIDEDLFHLILDEAELELEQAEEINKAKTIDVREVRE